MLHKMRLATFVAISIGISLFLFSSQMKNPETFYEIRTSLLAVPLVISLLLLVGLRRIVNIPLTLQANWIFILTEVRAKKDYFIGLRKALFFLILIPLFTGFYILYAYFWGSTVAFYHCVFGLIMSVFLMNVLFVNFRKIPFTCSYLPGTEKLHLLWLVYLYGFFIYVLGFARIETSLLKNPVNFLYFYAGLFILYVLIRIFQDFYLYKRVDIKFEEVPEPVMVGLGTGDS